MNESLLSKESVIDELAQFFELHRIEQPSLIHVSLPYTLHDPLAIAEFIPKNTFSFFWERTDLEISLCCGESSYEIQSSYQDKEGLLSEVSRLKEQTYLFGFKDHSLSAPIFVGGMAFSDQLNSDLWSPFGKLKLTAPLWTYLKNGQFALLNITIAVDENSTFNEVNEKINAAITKVEGYTTQITAPSPEPDRLHFHIVQQTSFEKWDSEIQQAKVLFSSGEAQKLVLARALDIEANREIEPARFVNRLRSQYPSCYTFYLRVEEGSTFLGSSPERLVSFHKNYILTEALAGTISRGKSAKEDAYLEQQLLQSKKDIGEHQIVVSEIVKRLEPFSREIQQGEKPGIRKIANVQHLHTPITAWIHKKTELLNLFFELHPTPAVGGYPKEVAKQTIPQLEDFDRGWYASPIGWFNLADSGEFAVGIRSGILTKNKARFYAGCGIVPDSDSMKEWEETKLKFIPMLNALEFA